jgi:chemotaxis protein methyltransferase CheR
MPPLPLEPAAPQAILSPAAMVKPSGISMTLTDVRRHADRGGWEEADRCCEDLLEKNTLDWRVHFYRGLVLKQMRKHAEAEESLRRAIYLNRNAVLAHYYLGLFLQSRGDLHQAARSFKNVLDLLRSRRDTETFADADGMTVSELKKLAAIQVEILRESA